MRALLPLSKSGARARGLTARRLRSFALVGSLGLSSSALAEAPPQPVTGAATGASTDDALRRAQRMLLEKAKQRYEAGRREPVGEGARAQLEGALGALDLAYRLAPAPWLLFNMAQVESQLGACGKAAELYRRYLASHPAPEARANAEQALGLLGTCEGSNEMAAGDALLPGLRIPSSLDSIAGAASPAGLVSRQASSADGAADESGSALAALPWAFGGLAVMSGVAGAIYWNEAHSAKRDLDRIHVAGPEVAQTQERGESAQNLSRVFGGFAVGFALAAGASYWWLGPARGEAPEVSSPSLSLLPLEGGAGAVYRSAF